MAGIGGWCRVRAIAVLTCVLSITPCQMAAASTSSSGVDNPTLEFVTEELPPFNFNNNGKADGFGSEVVREILRRSNLSAPLTVLPWPRAYKMAQTEANVGLYCLVRSVDREKQFQWVGPIANTEARFYANRDSTLHIDSLDDARKAHGVIVLREGYNAQLLERLGFKNLWPVNNAIEGLRLLLISGDKTLFLVAANTVPGTMSKTGTPADAVKPLMTLTKTQMYIGFSLDTSPVLISRLQHSLDNMKTDGSFAAIHQKWFPGAKPPAIEREPDLLPPD
jgi:polar amino acid transport system substrate-binding protein